MVERPHNADESDDLAPREPLKERVTPPAPPLSRYVLMNAPVSKLFVDRRYQRGMVKAQVQYLVENWNWNKYHPIIISHRADGRYAIIAGQQRTLAAQELGISELPAIMMTHTDIPDEAESYLGSGKTANIGAGDRFKARIVANDTKAMDIWNEVDKSGFSLMCMQEDAAGKADPYAIKAVYALEQIYDQGILPRVLYTIRSSWGGAPVPDMVTSNMLMGVYLAIRHLEYFEVSDDMAAKSWAKVDVKDILDRGYDRYKSMVGARSTYAGVAAVLVDAFNYRRREQVPEYSKRIVKSQGGRRAAEHGAGPNRFVAGEERTRDIARKGRAVQLQQRD